MGFTYYDVEGENATDINLRWVQPPQIAYFVTTIDRQGNTNVTPVTMGTSFGPPFYYTFALSNLFVPNWYTARDKPNVKHGYINLREVPECVISYFGHELLRESWIAGMPVPRGINEMEVAGLTPLPSRKVAPPGIAECPVNIESRIISSQRVGSSWMIYVCEIVAVSVSSEYVSEDAPRGGIGVLAVDPVFEVKIGRGETADTASVRLYYARMDPGKIERCPEDIGCDDYWIGSFEQWLADEQKRGKLSDKDKTEIIDLNTRWQQDRNPHTNGAVKRELTARLQRLVSSR